MKKPLFSFVPLLLALGATAPVFAGEKTQVDENLAAVEKKLLKEWEKLKSMTAVRDMQMTMQGVLTKSKGTVEFVNNPDGERFRIEMTTEMSLGGRELTSTSTTIFDGELVHTLSEVMGQKKAFKQKLGALPQSPAGRQMFKALKEKNDLKVLPREKVDGKAAFVIEAAPKGPTAKRIARMKIFLTKQNGIIVKILGYDDAGTEVMTIVHNNIKVNPQVDESRFVFKAPEDAQIVDFSNR